MLAIHFDSFGLVYCAGYTFDHLHLEYEAMKPRYFVTRVEAEVVYLAYVDEIFPNRFQDAFSIARIKIVEFTKGFAIQFGDYGPYLE